MTRFDRRQVLAYRIAAQGLHRTEHDPLALNVFDLGVQNTQGDTALLSLAARLNGEVTPHSLTDDSRFTLGWTHRGAPHFHRTADLPEVIAALVPQSEADAMARLQWRPAQVGAAGMSATEALFTAARMIRKVVRAPMLKGAVSTAVTKLLPDSLSHWCRGCQATHISEQLMRVAAMHGGTCLAAGVTPATLAPLRNRPKTFGSPDPSAATAVASAYLRLHGPASSTDAAGFINTTTREVAGMWPGSLAEVTVDGRRAFLPAQQLPALESPPEPTPVRLLPAWDPFLQSRDRSLLVPERERQKQVWKILGNPGALLAHGEVVGTWRAKSAGKRLEVNISPFETLTSTVKTEAENEAGRLAAARGFDRVRFAWTT